MRDVLQCAYLKKVTGLGVSTPGCEGCEGCGSHSARAKAASVCQRRWITVPEEREDMEKRLEDLGVSTGVNISMVKFYIIDTSKSELSDLVSLLVPLIPKKEIELVLLEAAESDIRSTEEILNAAKMAGIE